MENTFDVTQDEQLQLKSFWNIFVIFTINYVFLQGKEKHTIVCNIIIFFHSIVNIIIHTEGNQEKSHIMMRSVIIWAECLKSNLAIFEMLFSQSNTVFQIKY